MVWIGNNMTSEGVQVGRPSLKDDQCPMTEWTTMFDRMCGGVGTEESIQLAVEGAAEDAHDIYEKGVFLLPNAHIPN